jgi:precorrin-6x reductase
MSTDAVWKTVAAAVGRPAVQSILMRLYNTIIQAQQRRAQREVARYFADRGPLSDALEREIMRRLSGRWPF